MLPRIIPNAIPKSGTNLLLSLLHDIPGLNRRPEAIPSHLWHLSKKYSNGKSTGKELVLIDVDLPHLVSSAMIRELFQSLKPGEYLTGAHLSYSKPMAELIAAENLKMLLIIRDPRDVVVSQVHFALNEPTNPLRRYFSDDLKNMSHRINASITGTPGHLLRLDCQHVSVAQRFNAILGWLIQPYVHLVRFEDLIGARGGGSSEKQRQVIGDILNFLGIPTAADDIKEIADETFSTKSFTFRKGEVKQWKKEFSKKNCTIFKEIAGQTLIDFGYEADFDW